MAKRKSTPRRKPRAATLDHQRLQDVLLRARGARFPEVEAERDDERARAHEAETRLQRHRRGGRKLVVDDKEVRDRAPLAAQVWQAVKDERARRPHHKNPAIYAAVNVQFGRKPKSSWAYQLWCEHEETRTKE